MTTIAFLGLGAMGSRMAARLLAAGHAVHVYNRNPDRAVDLVEAGAILARSPRAAAAAAELVIAMVRDDEASRAVWTDPELGALAGARPGTVMLECSTVTPAWIARLDAATRAIGGVLLDAPVLGSRPQAEAGALVVSVQRAAS